MADRCQTARNCAACRVEIKFTKQKYAWNCGSGMNGSMGPNRCKKPFFIATLFSPLLTYIHICLFWNLYWYSLSSTASLNFSYFLNLRSEKSLTSNLRSEKRRFRVPTSDWLVEIDWSRLNIATRFWKQSQKMVQWTSERKLPIHLFRNNSKVWERKISNENI